MMKGMKNVLVVGLLLLMIIGVSCDPARKYEKEEKNQIENFLAENSDKNYQKQNSGLYYSETQKGTGIQPVLYDSAWVKYTGKFLDGTVFDSNADKPTLYAFIVGQNILGFDEGVMMMQEGGKCSLLIPSNLAYGASGHYFINGYTPLNFEIELVKARQKSSR